MDERKLNWANEGSDTLEGKAGFSENMYSLIERDKWSIARTWVCFHKDESEERQ